jgi:hypothetical protein
MANAISMAQWKEKSTYKVGTSDFYGTIKGLNGWELNNAWSTGDKVTYNLSNEKMNMPKVDENNFQETENYFYAQVYKNPTIYRYVSKSEGGAIPFRGAGRWSGSAKNFGIDLKKKLDDVYLGKTAGYAMPIDEIKNIVRKNFPGLTFKSTENDTIYIDWSRVITDKKDILRTLVRTEIRTILKNRGIQLNEYISASSEIDGSFADIQVGTAEQGKIIALGIRNKNESAPLKYITLTKEETRRLIDTLQKLL